MCYFLLQPPIPDEDSQSLLDPESVASPSSLVATPTSKPALPSKGKPGKKRKGEPDSTDQLVGLATEYFKRPETEEDILAEGWAMKLKKLPPDQRLFAGKIINDTLFEAEMGTLTREGVRFQTYPSWSPSPPSSTYSNNSWPRFPNSAEPMYTSRPSESPLPTTSNAGRHHKTSDDANVATLFSSFTSM